MQLAKQTGVTFDDTFFGLDISSRCIGWASITGPSYLTGHAKFRGDNFGWELFNYQNWLFDMVRMHQPAVIAIEAPFVGRGNAVPKLYGYHGATDIQLRDFVGLKVPVHAPTWKSKVCGKGNILTKDKEAGLVCNILSTKGFSVGHIDEADALCVALCARLEMIGKLK